MMMLATETAYTLGKAQFATTLFVFVGTFAAVALGYRPFLNLIGWQRNQFDRVLCKQMLIDVSPVTASVVAGVQVLVVGFVCAIVGGSVLMALGMVVASFVPSVFLGVMRRRHLGKLEQQLVPGVQTLASGVRAGLNLVQAMELIGRDGPDPLRSEFAHLLREYDFGMGLEDAIGNASARIGSSDFRLLFSALLTHRQRGGDLGETLDRIGESIREIQRLEGQVIALTAQGRATARFMGAMPALVLVAMYFLFGASGGVTALFHEPLGKIMLLAMAVLNVSGFLWIRKIMQVDI
jgi:tight adherence protein B